MINENTDTDTGIVSQNNADVNSNNGLGVDDWTLDYTPEYGREPEVNRKLVDSLTVLELKDSRGKDELSRTITNSDGLSLETFPTNESISNWNELYYEKDRVNEFFGIELKDYDFANLLGLSYSEYEGLETIDPDGYKQDSRLSLRCDRYNDSTPQEVRLELEDEDDEGVATYEDLVIGKFLSVAKLKNSSSSVNGDSVLSRYLEVIRENQLLERAELHGEFENDEEAKDWYNARMFIYYPQTKEYYLYSVLRGCYEKVDSSKVGSAIKEVARDMIADFLISLLPNYTVGEGENRHAPYSWVADLPSYRKNRLKSDCKWLYSFVNDIHKDAMYSITYDSSVISGESLTRTHSRYVNVANGVVDMETKKLLPHSPKYGFDYCIGNNFLVDDLGVVPKRTLEFWQGALKRPDLHIDTIRAAIVVASTGSGARTQCYLEFTGVPGSGKGTTQKIFTRAVGLDNTYGSSLERLSNRFETIAFIDKRHLRVGDAKKFLNDRVFLMITGADELAIEIKGLSHISTKAFSGMVTVSSNAPVSISDSSLAIERRRRLIAFNQREGKKKELLEYVNGEWIGELVDEGDALLTWALMMPIGEAVDYLRDVAEVDDENKLLALVESNNVFDFMNDNLILDLKGFTPLDITLPTPAGSFYEQDLYPRFVTWWRHSKPGVKVMSKNEFTKNFESLAGQSFLKPHFVKKKRNKKRNSEFRDKWGFSGITLKTFDELHEQEIPNLIEQLSEFNEDS